MWQWKKGLWRKLVRGSVAAEGRVAMEEGVVAQVSKRVCGSRYGGSDRECGGGSLLSRRKGRLRQRRGGSVLQVTPLHLPTHILMHSRTAPFATHTLLHLPTHILLHLLAAHGVLPGAALYVLQPPPLFQPST